METRKVLILGVTEVPATRHHGLQKCWCGIDVDTGKGVRLCSPEGGHVWSAARCPKADVGEVWAVVGEAGKRGKPFSDDFVVRGGRKLETADHGPHARLGLAYRIRSLPKGVQNGPFAGLFGGLLTKMGGLPLAAPGTAAARAHPSAVPSQSIVVWQSDAVITWKDDAYHYKTGSGANVKLAPLPGAQHPGTDLGIGSLVGLTLAPHAAQGQHDEDGITLRVGWAFDEDERRVRSLYMRSAMGTWERADYYDYDAIIPRDRFSEEDPLFHIEDDEERWMAFIDRMMLAESEQWWEIPSEWLEDEEPMGREGMSMLLDWVLNEGVLNRAPDCWNIPHANLRNLALRLWRDAWCGVPQGWLSTSGDVDDFSIFFSGLGGDSEPHRDVASVTLPSPSHPQAADILRHCDAGIQKILELKEELWQDTLQLLCGLRRLVAVGVGPLVLASTSYAEDWMPCAVTSLSTGALDSLRRQLEQPDATGHWPVFWGPMLRGLLVQLQAVGTAEEHHDRVAELTRQVATCVLFLESLPETAWSACARSLGPELNACRALTYTETTLQVYADLGGVWLDLTPS